MSGKPASTADGTVRGWTDRSCTKQGDGPCTPVQFDYPWSPLPAGVTECQVGAVINDPDPAGLNVRDAPDQNARVLGRLPPTRPSPSPVVAAPAAPAEDAPAVVVVRFAAT